MFEKLIQYQVKSEVLYALEGDMADGSISTQDLPPMITDLDPAEDQEQILMLTYNLRHT